MASRVFDIRIWIPVTLFSLLAHTIYWSIPTIEQTVLDFPGPYFSNGIPMVGSILRIIGIIIALSVSYLVWGPPKKTFVTVKGKISVALLLEAIYYFTFIPTAIFLIVELSVLQGILYSLFSLLLAPFLLILSLYLWLSKAPSTRGMLRGIGAASLGYIVALWTATVANFVDAVLVSGLDFLASGSAFTNFFNSVIILSLALLFAIVTLVPILNRGIVSGSTKKWGGLCLIVLGTFFTIYLISALLTASLTVALLGDVWLIPSLGLGLSLFLMKTPE